MEKMRRPKALHSRGAYLGGVFIVLCIASSAYSQLEPAAQQAQEGRVANFRYAEASELTITVNLIGAVRSPGRYEISRSIDLMSLIALAGGWTETADLTEVHINRLSGSGELGERKDLKLNLYDFQNVSRSYLTLQHGDFIFVGSKTGITATEVLSWVTTAAILTTLYFTIIDRNPTR